MPKLKYLNLFKKHMDAMKLNYQSRSKFQVVFCGLKYLHLENKTVQILGCHYFYIKGIQQEKKLIQKSYNIENMFVKMRQLTSDGTITAF